MVKVGDTVTFSGTITTYANAYEASRRGTVHWHIDYGGGGWTVESIYTFTSSGDYIPHNSYTGGGRYSLAIEKYGNVSHVHPSDVRVGGSSSGSSGGSGSSGSYTGGSGGSYTTRRDYVGTIKLNPSSPSIYQSFTVGNGDFDAMTINFTDDNENYIYSRSDRSSGGYYTVEFTAAQRRRIESRAGNVTSIKLKVRVRARGSSRYAYNEFTFRVNKETNTVVEKPPSYTPPEPSPSPPPRPAEPPQASMYGYPDIDISSSLNGDYLVGRSRLTVTSPIIRPGTGTTLTRVWLMFEPSGKGLDVTSLNNGTSTKFSKEVLLDSSYVGDNSIYIESLDSRGRTKRFSAGRVTVVTGEDPSLNSLSASRNGSSATISANGEYYPAISGTLRYEIRTRKSSSMYTNTVSSGTVSSYDSGSVRRWSVSGTARGLESDSSYVVDVVLTDSSGVQFTYNTQIGQEAVAFSLGKKAIGAGVLVDDGLSAGLQVGNEGLFSYGPIKSQGIIDLNPASAYKKFTINYEGEGITLRVGNSKLVITEDDVKFNGASIK